MTFLYGCTIENCGGAGMKVDGDAVAFGTNNTIRDCDVGIDVESGGSATLSGWSVENNRTSGVRVRDGNFVGKDFSVQQNRIGIDLRNSSRGDVFDSDLTRNDDFDIRYDNDVLFGLYDT